MSTLVPCICRNIPWSMILLCQSFDKQSNFGTKHCGLHFHTWTIRLRFASCCAKSRRAFRLANGTSCIIISQVRFSAGSIFEEPFSFLWFNSVTWNFYMILSSFVPVTSPLISRISQCTISANLPTQIFASLACLVKAFLLSVTSSPSLSIYVFTNALRISFAVSRSTLGVIVSKMCSIDPGPEAELDTAEELPWLKPRIIMSPISGLRFKTHWMLHQRSFSSDSWT